MRRLVLGLVLLSLPSIARAGMPATGAGRALPDAGPVGEGSPVEVPRRAAQPVRVGAGNRSVETAFSLLGARDVVGVESCGETRFFGALSGADAVADVSIRRIDGGVESLVSFAERPRTERLTYVVDARGAAGLRLVEGVLELLDAEGTPQLRVRAPGALDARGERHDASLTLDGCDFDESAVGPWGRAVVAPGSDTCELTVSWGTAVGDRLAYPLTIDTAWVDGGTLVSPRSAHAAIALSNDRVLVAGGYRSMASSRYTASAELFDPGTGTWSVTASMSRPRAHHAAVLLPERGAAGRALFVGGDDELEPSAETYDPETGRWLETEPMRVARDGGSVATLADGRVLAAGGCSAYGSTCTSLEASAEIFDPATNAWSSTRAPMLTARSHFTMTTLGDGRVLAAGGCTSFGDAFSCGASTSSVELFDPATGQWQPASPLPAPVHDHVAAQLATGEVLVAGGVHAGSASRRAETYDPDADTWTVAGELEVPRAMATASVLGDGRVLVAGSLSTGEHGAVVRDTSELFDPARRAWVPGPTMAHSHGGHTASALSDGRVLIAGGVQQGGGSTVRASAVGELYRGPSVSTTAYAQPIDDAEDDGLERFTGCDIGGAPREGTLALAMAALVLGMLARRRRAGRLDADRATTSA